MSEPGTEEVLRVGTLEIVPAHYVARTGDEVIPMTPKEFALLVTLARHEGRVCSREMLYELVWEQPLLNGERAVDVYVRKLRVKLEQALPHWQFIHTHHRIGYRLSPRAHMRAAARPRERGHSTVATDANRLRTKEKL